MKLDQYEPRAEDDRLDAEIDLDKVYCANCGEVVEDDDHKALMRSSGRPGGACTWIHDACVDHELDAAEEFAPTGSYEWRANQKAFLAGIAFQKSRQPKGEKS